MAIEGTSGNDKIDSSGTVHADGGNDTIIANSGSVIYAGSGNDVIKGNTFSYENKHRAEIHHRFGRSFGLALELIPPASNVTINGGAGNDSVEVYNTDYDINVGYGDDTIRLDTTYHNISNVTITGSAGDDVIQFDGSNDISAKTIDVIITDLENGDTLYNNYTNTNELEKSTVGGNIVLTEPGQGGINITLQGVSDISQVSGVVYRTKSESKTLGEIFGVSAPAPMPTTDFALNRYSNVTLTATSGDDIIQNLGDCVKINAGAGNDTIQNVGHNVKINADEGDDYIYNSNSSHNVKINAGAGNDTIQNSGSYVSIVAGSGDDTIFSFNDYVTINAGIGNDSISLSSGDYTNYNVIEYATGDDIIFNFVATDTLDLKGAQYSTVAGGNDVFVSVGNGNIILKDSSNLSSININGTLIVNPTTPSPIPISNVDNYFYSGGYQTISSYDESKQVTLATDFKGFTVNDDTLNIKADDGYLTIKNMRNKTFSFGDSANNLYAYAFFGNNGSSSTVGGSYNTIDFSNKQSVYSVLIGGDDINDKIVAGAGCSSLWGGSGSNADTLIGGAGVDEFVYRKGDGWDVIQNAGDEDIVNLDGIDLSQILTANVSYDKVSAIFKDGGSLKINGNANVGFRVAGVTFAANRSNGSWYKK